LLWDRIFHMKNSERPIVSMVEHISTRPALMRECLGKIYAPNLMVTGAFGDIFGWQEDMFDFIENTNLADMFATIDRLMLFCPSDTSYKPKRESSRGELIKEGQPPVRFEKLVYEFDEFEIKVSYDSQYGGERIECESPQWEIFYEEKTGSDDSECIIIRNKLTPNCAGILLGFGLFEEKSDRSPVRYIKVLSDLVAGNCEDVVGTTSEDWGKKKIRLANLMKRVLVGDKGIDVKMESSGTVVLVDDGKQWIFADNKVLAIGVGEPSENM
jgi:hypothetical protein